MPSASEHPEKSLPPPWDRIFSLTTRAFVWGLLIAVLYVLRPFLLLVFMTFVFAYIQAHGVDGLAHRIKNRPTRVIIVGLVFLGTLFATGFTLVPEIQAQANTFWENREKYIKQGDQDRAMYFLAQGSLQVFVTGGDAGRLAAYACEDPQHIEELVLAGAVLRHVAGRAGLKRARNNHLVGVLG